MKVAPNQAIFLGILVTILSSTLAHVLFWLSVRDDPRWIAIHGGRGFF